jgi:hypothetical protein
MEFKGKIKSIGSIEQKTPKFTIRKFVVETEGKYPTVVEFQLINDKVNLIEPYVIGDDIEISFNIEGREYNGNVYNSLKAWNIKGDIKMPDQTPTEVGNPSVSPTKEDGDLPF